MGRGLFIVIEGCDRAGKTTQANRLSDHLNKILGQAAVQIRFPDRNCPETGGLLDAFLKTATTNTPSSVEFVRDLHTLFSLNRKHAQRCIIDLLQSGKHVICDRYSYSGAAYSHAQGVDLDFCLTSELGLLEPDLVIFLDIHPTDLARRPRFGQERYEVLDFQIKVYEAYQQVFSAHKADPRSSTVWINIRPNPNAPIDAITQMIFERTLPCLSPPRQPHDLSYFAERVPETI